MSKLQTKRTGKQLDIIIYGEIGAGWFSQGITAEGFVHEMEKHDDAENINIRINSPGGNVFEGIAIYNTLRRMKGKKTVIIDGICASIATVIAMAGDEIVMAPVSDFMIHDPTTYTAGDAEDLRKDAAILDLIKDNIVTAYATRAKVTKDEIRQMMTDETWMDPQTALTKGFITQIEAVWPVAGNAKNEAFTGFYNFAKIPEKYKHLFPENSYTEKSEKKEDKKKMPTNKEDFRNQNPDLYNEILNEGATNERARMEALDKLAGKVTDKGALDMIYSAKYKEPKNAADIALDIVDKVTAVPAPAEKTIADKFEEKKNEVNKDDLDNSTDGGSKKETEDAETRAIMAEVIRLANA